VENKMARKINEADFMVDDIPLLIEIKNQIKDLVIDSSLRWDERMVLYRQVQFINQRIKEIEGKHNICISI
jgi:hypothetical protein